MSDQSISRSHPDDEAVDRFAEAMKIKLAAARRKGRGGWDDREVCSDESLAAMLVAHLSKGNAGNFEDVANFAMMLHQRGADPALLAAAAEAPKQQAVSEALSLGVNALNARAERPKLPSIPEMFEHSRVPDDFRNQASAYRAGWNDCRAWRGVAVEQLCEGLAQSDAAQTDRSTSRPAVTEVQASGGQFVKKEICPRCEHQFPSSANPYINQLRVELAGRVPPAPAAVIRAIMSRREKLFRVDFLRPDLLHVGTRLFAEPVVAAGLAETLQRLEKACDRRAALMTSDAYRACSLIPGMDDALLELDEARKQARAALSAEPGESHD